MWPLQYSSEGPWILKPLSHLNTAQEPSSLTLVAPWIRGPGLGQPEPNAGEEREGDRQTDGELFKNCIAVFLSLENELLTIVMIKLIYR